MFCFLSLDGKLKLLLSLIWFVMGSKGSSVSEFSVAAKNLAEIGERTGAKHLDLGLTILKR